MVPEHDGRECLDGDREPRTERSASTARSALIGALVPGALCAVFVGLQLAQPDALGGVAGFDEGVYFGAALRLSHGLLPYTDFSFVHPPGITILMLPIASIGRVVGDGNAFAIARIVTGVIAIANVVLIATIVRRHGTVASIVAATWVACFPLAVAGTHGVLLEPYVLFFTLLAVTRVFDETGAVADQRRLWVGGCLFGVATVVKLWGLLPLLAATLVVVAVTRSRRRVAALIGGAALGFSVPAFVFVVLAPVSFVRQVIVAQVVRTGGGTWALPVDERLSMLTGMQFFPTSAGASTAVWTSILGGSLIAIIFAVGRNRLRPSDAFAVSASVLVVGGVLSSATFYRYYTYVPTAMIALVVGTAVGLTRSMAVDGLVALGVTRARSVAAVTGGLLTVTVLLTVAIVPYDVQNIRNYLAPAHDSSELIRQTIPTGSCVLFDEPAPLIVADRFSTPDRSCPRVVDPFGLFLTDNGGRETADETPFDTAFVDSWQRWLAQADYVVLVARRSSFVPWTPALAEQFDRQFELVETAPRTFIFRRRA